MNWLPKTQQGGSVHRSRSLTGLMKSSSHTSTILTKTLAALPSPSFLYQRFPSVHPTYFRSFFTSNMTNGEGLKTNRLAEEKSPYLLQHKNNPVDWYPWGEEAFKVAKEQNKPIFLSVGYSTCHWCHVMEKESFESDKIAQVMNANFVNIKVDREERPNVDRVYMTFVQATTGHGGWPMSVWLTPDLKPIFGGTYFPPTDKYGTPGFVSLCKQISKLWVADKEKLIRSGDEIIQQLQNAIKSTSGSTSKTAQIFSWKVAEKCFENFSKSFDSVNGGFDGAPKFPTPVSLYFLLRYHTYMKVSNSLFATLPTASIGKLRSLSDRYGLDLKIGTGGLLEKPEVAEAVKKGLEARKKQSDRALEIVDFTLTKIKRGGIHDHIGQGFHRYSVDEAWHIPHFEKMLYDQSQLLEAFIDAYQVTKKPEFAEAARDILHYVQRDLLSYEGGFFCAEDADSLPTSDATEKKEGAFAVWEFDEIVSILGEENAKICNAHFGVKPGGNAGRNDPHKELVKKNVLIERQTLQDTAKEFGIEEKKVCDILVDGKAKLWKARKLRPKPHRDDKIITSWNGLMISAIARAYQVLVVGDADGDASNKNLLNLATRAASFFKVHMYDEDRRILKRSFRDGASDVEGFADDYAFLIHGLLDLYETGFDEMWLQWAVQLQETQDKLFWDKENGGYFSGQASERILLNLKEDHDGAEPSPSSVSIFNLLRLDALAPTKGESHGTESEYKKRATKTIESFGTQLLRHPNSMPRLVANLGAMQRGLKEIVIHGTPPATDDLLQAVHSIFIPNRSLALADPKRSEGFIYNRSETFASITDKPVEVAEVFVCRGFECGMPVETAEDVVRALDDD